MTYLLRIVLELVVVLKNLTLDSSSSLLSTPVHYAAIPSKQTMYYQLSVYGCTYTVLQGTGHIALSSLLIDFLVNREVRKSEGIFFQGI